MHFIDVLQGTECNKIFEEVNEFVDLYLRKYNSTLKTTSLSNKGKEIFDSIWGSVKLSPIEVLIIDSPLIQRLKNIKQLGYAYQVYCNADYNRFAHTIGVVETSKRITEIISEKVPKDHECTFDFESIIRIAAIMHDSGHTFFSHVSEKFFLYNEKFPRNAEVKNSLNHFNEKLSDRASLHEMFSVMIVNSRSFLELLHIIYFDKFTSEDEQRTIIDYISGFIVGIAVDKKMLPYSKVIKGSIDADRMDYLSRDSYTTKVPLAVDLARLINKISIIKKEKFNPSSVWNDDNIGSFNEIAIQYSAQRLVWQMSMARTILYQNVYFHHKKLTAEAILDKALENIFLLVDENQLSFTYILSLTDNVFSEHFASILNFRGMEQTEEFIEASRLILLLRDREFFKRVAGFSKETIKSSSVTSYELFKTHVIENPFSDKFFEFTHDLAEEYKQILNILKKEIPGKAPQFMFIQAGWSPEAETGLPIDIGDDKYIMSTELFKEAPIIGEENKQKHYYLLTDSNDRDIVYLALEKMLFKKKKFTLTNAAYSCTKFNSGYLNKKRTPLFEKGYYDGVLEILPDSTINNLLDTDMFATVVNKYRSFAGANGTYVTKETLMFFLRQFLILECTNVEIRLLLDGILRMLNAALFINRNCFTTNMASILDEIAKRDVDSCYIVRLGGFFDSSNRLSWFFNEIDISKKYQFFENVESALLMTDNKNCCICLFDDGAYSGTQVISIFQELMGVQEDKTTDEHHADELSPKAKELIKNTKIILSYVCFNSDSQERILKELSSLGINNVEIIYRQDLKTKTFGDSNSIFRDEPQRDLVKSKLQEIGYEIINSQKIGHWDDERIKKAALGYNNAQQMVIFDVNVPTYTISPFWANGTYRGREWKGLFQRTDNSKKSKK